MNFIRRYYKTPLFACLFLSSLTAQSNPIACFNTNIGNFCIELFETQTPITTANFLSYTNSDAYTKGIFHRSVPGFIVQGGGFKIVDGANSKSLAQVSTFPPITNEFKLSNTRGTVAMAKINGNPDSATSQWFINLADNNQGLRNLDTQNGGFTVFGRIIFDGMNVIDAIGNLPVTNLSASLGRNLTETPTINYDGSNILVSNLVQIDHVTVTHTTGVFSESVLSFAVDIGTGTALAVNLKLIADNPAFIFELDLTSIASLPSKPANIATFLSQNGQLHIPSVMINTTTQINNVVMALTNAETYQFTLLSYE